jgi:hypothetical protein
MDFLFSVYRELTSSTFAVHVTVHRRHSEGKEPAFQVWPPKSERYSLIVLLMVDILVPETCEAIKTAKTA